MQDVSGFGLKLRLIASVTFPAGITLTQFADDADPFDLPSIQLADTATGLNGDLITWSKANPIKTTVNVVPDSEDDRNLAVLANANRVGRGKNSSRDVITLVGVYPSGRTVTLSAGKITDGAPGNSVSSAGRMKSKAYAFAFEGLSA